MIPFFDRRNFDADLARLLRDVESNRERLRAMGKGRSADEYVCGLGDIHRFIDGDEGCPNHPTLEERHAYAKLRDDYARALESAVLLRLTPSNGRAKLSWITDEKRLREVDLAFRERGDGLFDVVKHRYGSQEKGITAAKRDEMIVRHNVPSDRVLVLPKKALVTVSNPMSPNAVFKHWTEEMMRGRIPTKRGPDE